MKILCMLLLVTLYACNDKEPTRNQTEGASKIEAANSTNSAHSASSIIEENDACICTKDWRPVCGDNGVTYPNACQAECDKVKSYTEGACSE